MYRFCIAICFATVLVWIFGCSKAQQAAAPVAQIKGTIMLDGNAVHAGEIHFGMAGVPPKVLAIKDGAFSGEAPIGENKVELFIYVDGPATEKYGGTRSKINAAPEMYWGANTALSATVTAGGPNEFKFDLSK